MAPTRGSETDTLIGIEDVYGTAFDDRIIGNSETNRLEGGFGNDNISGGEGADYIFGGSGNDHIDTGNEDSEGFSYDTGDNFADGGDGNDVLIGRDGNDTLQGGHGNDIIFGEDGVDQIIGGDGADRLTSGSGFDIVDSGAGNDILLLDSYGDNVTGGAGADYFGFASATSPIQGIEFNIRDFDVSGGDIIDLSIWSWYAAAQESVPVEFIGSAEFDADAGPQVRYALTADGNTEIQFTDKGQVDLSETRTILLLGSHVLSTDDFLLGYSLTDGNDVVTGTEYPDDLTGRLGDDILRGAGGDDYIDGGAGNDDLAGGEGADYVVGDDDDDLVYGGPGNDYLWGMNGADKLGPGFGVDRLYGGLGNDLFDFNQGDTGVGAAARDAITDFAKGDRIDLTGIDAKSSAVGDQSFFFIGGAGFVSGQATGQLHVVTVGGVRLIEGSVDADSAPEFQIEILGYGGGFVRSDFVL